MQKPPVMQSCGKMDYASSSPNMPKKVFIMGIVKKAKYRQNELHCTLYSFLTTFLNEKYHPFCGCHNDD